MRHCIRGHLGFEHNRCGNINIVLSQSSFSLSTPLPWLQSMSSPLPSSFISRGSVPGRTTVSLAKSTVRKKETSVCRVLVLSSQLKRIRLHTCLKLISLFTLVLSLPCFVFDGRFLIGFLRMWMLKRFMNL